MGKHSLPRNGLLYAGATEPEARAMNYRLKKASGRITWGELATTHTMIWNDDHACEAYLAHLAGDNPDIEPALVTRQAFLDRMHGARR